MNAILHDQSKARLVSTVDLLQEDLIPSDDEDSMSHDEPKEGHCDIHAVVTHREQRDTEAQLEMIVPKAASDTPVKVDAQVVRTSNFTEELVARSFRQELRLTMKSK